MKKILIIVVILLLGGTLIAYPHLANYLHVKSQTFEIREYEESVDEAGLARIEEEWQKARAYNDSLNGNSISDPFDEEHNTNTDDDYYDVLSLKNMMGYIVIPKIDIRLAVYHGTSQTVLEKGVGHLVGSALPIGGEDTHSILTGHTGLTNARLFTDLDQLEEGDSFYIHILDEVLAYQVDKKTIIEPSDTSELKTYPGEDYVTLITCHPYGVNSHRLLVRGTRVPYTQEAEAEEKKADKAGIPLFDPKTIRETAITAGVMLLLIVIVIIIKAVVEKRRTKESMKNWWDDMQ